MTNNFTGEFISPITGHVGFHLLSLLGSPQLDNTDARVGPFSPELFEPKAWSPCSLGSSDAIHGNLLLDRLGLVEHKK
jgi:hypothetical protein